MPAQAQVKDENNIGIWSKQLSHVCSTTPDENLNGFIALMWDQLPSDVNACDVLP